MMNMKIITFTYFNLHPYIELKTKLYSIANFNFNICFRSYPFPFVNVEVDIGSILGIMVFHKYFNVFILLKKKVEAFFFIKL